MPWMLAAFCRYRRWTNNLETICWTDFAVCRRITAMLEQRRRRRRRRRNSNIQQFGYGHWFSMENCKVRRTFRMELTSFREDYVWMNEHWEERSNNVIDISPRDEHNFAHWWLVWGLTEDCKWIMLSQETRVKVLWLRKVAFITTNTCLSLSCFVWIYIFRIGKKRKKHVEIVLYSWFSSFPLKLSTVQLLIKW